MMDFNAKLSREELEKNMMKDIDAIVKQWDDDGIIVEEDFSSLDHTVMKHSHHLVYDIIVSNGGHEAEYMPLAEEVEMEGWSYSFIDCELIELGEAKKRIKKNPGI